MQLHQAEIWLSYIMIALIGMLVIVLVVFSCGKMNIQKLLGNEKRDIYKKKQSSLYFVWKRIIDITMSSIVLLVMSPFIILCAFLIKLDGGPITYVKECVGYQGKTVRYRAFRTLKMHAQYTNEYEEDKIDRKLTKVGRVLRGFGLNYLPMFIAILQGRITLVGLARISPDKVSKEYIHLFDYAKPGLISLGSITDHKNIDTYEKMDLVYLQVRSFLSDIKIFLYTIRNVTYSIRISEEEKKTIEESVLQKQEAYSGFKNTIMLKKNALVICSFVIISICVMSITHLGLFHHADYILPTYTDHPHMTQSGPTVFPANSYPLGPTAFPKSLSNIMFNLYQFENNKRLYVYSAPSTSSWYTKGKSGEPVYASTNQSIYVAGYDGDWLLIKYPVNDGQYRIGYTKDASGDFANISFDYIPGTIIVNCVLSDGINSLPLNRGSSVMILGRIAEGIYVETYINGNQARGIIPESCVQW